MEALADEFQDGSGKKVNYFNRESLQRFIWSAPDSATLVATLAGSVNVFLAILSIPTKVSN